MIEVGLFSRFLSMSANLSASWGLLPVRYRESPGRVGIECYSVLRPGEPVDQERHAPHEGEYYAPRRGIIPAVYGFYYIAFGLDLESHGLQMSRSLSQHLLGEEASIVRETRILTSTLGRTFDI